MTCATLRIGFHASARLSRAFVRHRGNAVTISAAPSKRSNRSKALMEVLSL
jgi:hypothetical protein